jgi:hypothetical protein
MIVATHNLDDFTLWNNDSPIIVEKDLFTVSAAQAAHQNGAKDGEGEFCACKLARESGRHAGVAGTVLVAVEEYTLFRQIK